MKDETVRMAGGIRLFHARDAATGKARSPRVDGCTDGTTSVMVVEEPRWRRPLSITFAEKNFLNRHVFYANSGYRQNFVTLFGSKN